MNWYNIIKLAQIIEPASKFAFSDDLERMYEAEYKYSMMKVRPFNGVEVRKQNMLKLLENIMTGCIQDIRDVLINVFAGWLDKHTLLDPILWAKGREEGFENESEKISLEDAMWEFTDYFPELFTEKNKGNFAKENKFIKTISNNIDKIPSLQSFMEIFKQQDIDNLINDAIEEGKRHKQTKQEVNRAIKRIKENAGQLTFYEIYNEFYQTFDNFLEAFKDYGDAKQLLIEIRAAVIFPLWFNKWKQKGIEKLELMLKMFISHYYLYLHNKDILLLPLYLLLLILHIKQDQCYIM